jgi:hypothetical protein
MAQKHKGGKMKFIITKQNKISADYVLYMLSCITTILPQVVTPYS